MSRTSKKGEVLDAKYCKRTAWLFSLTIFISKMHLGLFSM